MSTIVDTEESAASSSNSFPDDGNIVMYNGKPVELKLKEDRPLTDTELELVKQLRMPKKMWGPHNFALNKTVDPDTNEYFVILYSPENKIRVYPIITRNTTYSDLRTVIAQCIHVDLDHVTFDNVPDLHVAVGLESFAIIQFSINTQDPTLTDDSTLTDAQRHPNYFDPEAYEVPVSDNPYVNHNRFVMKDPKTRAPEIALPFDNHIVSTEPIDVASVPTTQRVTGYDASLKRLLEKYPIRFAEKLDSEKILKHMQGLGYEVTTGSDAVQTTNNGLVSTPVIVKMDSKYTGQMHEPLIDDYLAIHVYFMPPAPEDRKFIEFTDITGGRYFVDLVVAATEFCMLKDMVALPACDGTGGVSTASFPFRAGENIVTVICDHLYYCAGFKAINEDWYEQDEQITDVSKQLIPHWVPFKHFSPAEYDAFYDMSVVLDF